MRKIGFLLVIVLTITACSHSEPAPPVTALPLKPTATKLPTSTPAPSPSPTPSPTPTATLAPLERITYPVGHAGSAAFTFAIITFSNNDGTGLEYTNRDWLNLLILSKF